MIIGVIILVLLVVVIVLLMKKKDDGLGADYKQLEERLIRVEGEVSKINPAIDRNFRENR